MYRDAMHTGTMYTGTLIDELIATVERTETRTEVRGEIEAGTEFRVEILADRRLLHTSSQEEKLAYWYAVAQREVAQIDSSLAGVA